MKSALGQRQACYPTLTGPALTHEIGVPTDMHKPFVLSNGRPVIPAAEMLTGQLQSQTLQQASPP